MAKFPATEIPGVLLSVTAVGEPEVPETDNLLKLIVADAVCACITEAVPLNVTVPLLCVNVALVPK